LAAHVLFILQSYHFDREKASSVKATCLFSILDYLVFVRLLALEDVVYKTYYHKNNQYDKDEQEYLEGYFNDWNNQ